jgi:hypothetical protein
VDAVIEAVRASGMQCGALVCWPFSSCTALMSVQERALELPKEHEMLAKDKYREVIERASTRCPNGRGYAYAFSNPGKPNSRVAQLTLRTNPKGF